MSALTHALGALTADVRTILENRLRAHVRSVGIRAGVLAIAAIFALICLFMSALAAFLALSEYFDPPVAAAITAALFLGVAIIALVIAISASFRPQVQARPPEQRPETAAATTLASDIETVADDIGQLERQLRELAGRNASALIIAGLVTGLAVSLRKNRS